MSELLMGGPGRDHRRSAFTLIELLIVIAIIALLISILLPALQAARNEGTKTVCLSGLKEIMKGNFMYEGDHDTREVPWYFQKPNLQGTTMVPAYVPPTVYASPTGITPWVFGGFRAPRPLSGLGGSPDCNIYPAQLRPLNKYLEPTAVCDPTDELDRGRDVIKLYVCPGDRSNQVSAIQDGPQFLPEEDDRPAHEAYGSSYGLNTRWLQGYEGSNFGGQLNGVATSKELFQRIARATVGGAGSRFIQWLEIGMYSAAHTAAERLEWSQAKPQRVGWHRKFSFWSAAFADGHAAHGFFDTRQVYGLGGSIWAPDYFRGTPP